MTEAIERINQTINKSIEYLYSFSLAFLSITGFIFGSFALLLLMLERVADISIILFSFKVLNILLLTGCFLIAIKIYLWLIKKFFLPIAKKSKAKRLKEFEEIIRSIIKKELKAGRKQ